MPKYINNYRKGVGFQKCLAEKALKKGLDQNAQDPELMHFVMHNAEKDLGKAMARGTQDPELALLQDNLTKQYTKLHSLDYYNEIVLDAKGDKPAAGFLWSVRR